MAIPQEEVQDLISQIQALVTGQGTSQGVSQTTTTQPSEDEAVLFESVEIENPLPDTKDQGRSTVHTNNTPRGREKEMRTNGY